MSSTNDLAARAGSMPANDGLVVLAEEQTAGRGQRGRIWTAPARSSILMSVLLFPPLDLPLPAVEDAARLRLAHGARRGGDRGAGLGHRTGCDARIKWPNDVRVDGRKIAGILVERALAPATRGGRQRDPTPRRRDRHRPERRISISDAVPPELGASRSRRWRRLPPELSSTGRSWLAA